AGARIERDERVAEQIVARTIAAIAVVRRRAKREVRNRASFVDGDLSPRVDAASPLVGAFGPCVLAEFAWIWNRVEGPDQLSCDDVERAEVARRRAVRFASDRTGQKQI